MRLVWLQTRTDSKTHTGVLPLSAFPVNDQINCLRALQISAKIISTIARFAYKSSKLAEIASVGNSVNLFLDRVSSFKSIKLEKALGLISSIRFDAKDLENINVQFLDMDKYRFFSDSNSFTVFILHISNSLQRISRSTFAASASMYLSF